jgi:hypothetical protein
VAGCSGIRILDEQTVFDMKEPGETEEQVFQRRDRDNTLAACRVRQNQCLTSIYKVFHRNILQFKLCYSIASKALGKIFPRIAPYALEAMPAKPT